MARGDLLDKRFMNPSAMPVCYLFYRRVHTRRSQKMRGRYVHATDPQREILKRTDPRFVSNRSFPGSLARIPRQLFDINTRSPDSPSFARVNSPLSICTENHRCIAIRRPSCVCVSLSLSLSLSLSPTLRNRKTKVPFRFFARRVDHHLPTDISNLRKWNYVRRFSNA